VQLYNWKDIAQKEMAPGIRLQAVHGEHMSLAHWNFEPDADLPEHSHPHEQIAILQEGRFVLTVGGESRELSPGDVVVIPPHVPHSGRSITAARVIDVFSPVREDMRD